MSNRWIEESNNNTCPYCRKHLEFEKTKVIDWRRISSVGRLPMEFIEKFQDKVDWKFISRHQKLSEYFIERF